MLEIWRNFRKYWTYFRENKKKVLQNSLEIIGKFLFKKFWTRKTWRKIPKNVGRNFRKRRKNLRETEKIFYTVLEKL